ncbi:glycosyltransferase [Streptomyces sp. NPDC051658]|uniref:glycosyltransferase n=1 Tax=Streptomyces sp. NPDC051658 TaxID=3365667 RepID=UPI0037A450F8
MANTFREPAPQATVLAPVTHFNTVPYIRGAVVSLLSQTYPNIRVAVMNDGGSDAPWGELDDIVDPRLSRFQMSRNVGPYFMNHVAAMANPWPYMTIQDSDDWSEPDRISELMNVLNRTELSVVSSATITHIVDNSTEVAKWSRNRRSDGVEDLSDRVTRSPREAAFNGARHQALFKTQFIREMGGYYAGSKVEYDTFIMCIAQLIGELDYCKTPLYHRRIRGESLTKSEGTGMTSNYRAQTRRTLIRYFEEAKRRRLAEDPHIRGYIASSVRDSVSEAEHAQISECTRVMHKALSHAGGRRIVQL